MKDVLAYTYAEALFGIAKESSNIENYQKEVQEIRNILIDNPDFVNVLTSPFLTLKIREEKLTSIFKSVSSDILNFLCIILKNNRFDKIDKILEAFNSLCNEALGVLEGYIYSTEIIKKELLSQIEEKISKLEKQKVHLLNRIDPNLIGGFKILINDKQYDFSIMKNIENLKKSLLGGKL